MSLPDEKLLALKDGRWFLESLLDPKRTPKVPKYIRLQSQYCLKHYPNDWELAEIAYLAPEYLDPEYSIHGKPVVKRLKRFVFDIKVAFTRLRNS